MKRTSKSEREHNALAFWNGSWDRAVVVAEMHESKTNPNINRCSLITTCSAFMSSPVVIAESPFGKMMALHEMLSFISKEKAQNVLNLMYTRSLLNNYLEDAFGFRITYDDGFSMIIERGVEKE